MVDENILYQGERRIMTKEEFLNYTIQLEKVLIDEGCGCQPCQSDIRGLLRIARDADAVSRGRLAPTKTTKQRNDEILRLTLSVNEFDPCGEDLTKVPKVFHEQEYPAVG